MHEKQAKTARFDIEDDKTTTYNIPIIIYKDKNTFQNIFNKNVSYFGINDENLAKKFVENIRGGEENGKECD